MGGLFYGHLAISCCNKCRPIGTGWDIVYQGWCYYFNVRWLSENHVDVVRILSYHRPRAHSLVAQRIFRKLLDICPVRIYARYTEPIANLFVSLFECQMMK